MDYLGLVLHLGGLGNLGGGGDLIANDKGY